MLEWSDEENAHGGVEGDDDNDHVDVDDVDKYIMIQCLWRFCLFLPCPPSPVQSCYDWRKHNITVHPHLESRK